MPDSALNGAEQDLQQSFRKIFVFNGLLLGVFVLLAYWPIHRLPERRARPETNSALQFTPVALPPATSPLRLAGAWELTAADPRFGGLSGLVLDHGRFLAVSDLGAVARFELPTAGHSTVTMQDLRIGPGSFGKKKARDAESIVRDPRGRGWWVGYEQHHSLWLYNDGFDHVLASVDLRGFDWSDNQGAEGLVVQRGKLLALAENGRDAVRIDDGRPSLLGLHSDIEVADAATAPDGSAWVLTRRKDFKGIQQSIAQLIEARDGFRIGSLWPLPKGALDNFEGMAIEPRADGRWRFWLVTDDGHRIEARTLLVALDLQVAHNKSPATSAGPSNQQDSKKP